MKRYKELDSLRGLAAMAVVFSHIIALLPVLPKYILYSPLRIIWSGNESVILFFVLSGFVLMLPFTKNNRKINYGNFLIKRFFRIYLPYMMTIIISFCLKLLFYNSTIKNIPWSDHWNQVVTNKNIISHFIFINNFNTETLDPVIWSLVHEMRISIIFPFLIFLVLRMKWINTIILAGFLTICGMLIDRYGLTISNGYMNSYGLTVHYTSMFLIGALLALNINKILVFLNQINSLFKVNILILGVFIYTMQTQLRIFIQKTPIPYISDWLILLGSVIFISISLSSIRFSRFLKNKPIHFLGKISYSLYLIHAPILMSTLYLLYDKVPLSIIPLVAVPVSICISAILYKYVEIPSIKLGKILTNKLDKNNNKLLEKIS